MVLDLTRHLLLATPVCSWYSLFNTLGTLGSTVGLRSLMSVLMFLIDPL